MRRVTIFFATLVGAFAIGAFAIGLGDQQPDVRTNGGTVQTVIRRTGSNVTVTVHVDTVPKGYATVSFTSRAGDVKWYMNGKLRATRTASPYTYEFSDVSGAGPCAAGSGTQTSGCLRLTAVSGSTKVPVVFGR